MYLSKEQIFSVKDYDLKEVEVPEWGGSVFVKPAKAGVIYKLKTEQTTLDKSIFKLLIHCVCDAEENPLFTEADIPKLSDKNGAVIDKLLKEVNKVNGWADEGLEKN